MNPSDPNKQQPDPPGDAVRSTGPVSRRDESGSPPAGQPGTQPGALAAHPATSMPPIPPHEPQSSAGGNITAQTPQRQSEGIKPPSQGVGSKGQPQPVEKLLQAGRKPPLPPNMQRSSGPVYDPNVQILRRAQARQLPFQITRRAGPQGNQESFFFWMRLDSGQKWKWPLLWDLLVAVALVIILLVAMGALAEVVLALLGFGLFFVAAHDRQAIHQLTAVFIFVAVIGLLILSICLYLLADRIQWVRESWEQFRGGSARQLKRAPKSVSPLIAHPSSEVPGADATGEGASGQSQAGQPQPSLVKGAQPAKPAGALPSPTGGGVLAARLPACASPESTGERDNDVQPAAAPPSLPTPTAKLEPAKFKNNPPVDTVYPDYPPIEDDVADAVVDLTEDWAVIGASLRGEGHRDDAKFREDAMKIAIEDHWHLVAIADGGGAYSLARIGANEAVDAAITGMRQKLHELGQMSWGSTTVGEDKKRLQAIIVTGFQSAVDRLAHWAHKVEQERPDIAQPFKQLRTTLLLLVHREVGQGRHFVAGAQIGDGIIVARCFGPGGPLPLTWLGQPDTGPSGNEVLFLQDVPQFDKRTGEDQWSKRVHVPPEPIEAQNCYFLAMTDGVADDFLPTNQYLERLEFFMFDHALSARKPDDAKVALREFLRYPREGSFDDRTLVCIYKPGGNPWK